MHPYIALITLLTVLLLMATLIMVGRARGRYGIKAPATTGHEGFERIFRVQGNTQEAALMFLPALWVAAEFGAVWLAATLGALWLLGRVWYVLAYANPARSRAMPFTVAGLANVVLVAQGLWGVIWTFVLA
ncbi:MAPEG family protein [Arenimonas sp. MALMAid1274]|uniref:MAPEG family protein n=1 Tax=Arenimonas sp. MALMAid1274 TaxID=3411630 RepID=UPI003BA3DC02